MLKVRLPFINDGSFMVSMSTALADREWGSESAVYRISGVFTVMGM